MPKYSVKKSFTILVAVILVLGVVSLLRIQTDLLPSMSPPYLLVMTTYPGASPEQVEADVTQPLADAAGIGKGTVYEYFSSKEEILQGLGHYCFEQENARVAERFDRCRTLVDLENELVARLQAAGEIDPGLTMGRLPHLDLLHRNRRVDCPVLQRRQRHIPARPARPAAEFAGGTA